MKILHPSTGKEYAERLYDPCFAEFEIIKVIYRVGHRKHLTFPLFMKEIKFFLMQHDYIYPMK
jgi:hypothetical protein